MTCSFRCHRLNRLLFSDVTGWTILQVSNVPNWTSWCCFRLRCHRLRRLLLRFRCHRLSHLCLLLDVTGWTIVGVFQMSPVDPFCYFRFCWTKVISFRSHQLNYYGTFRCHNLCLLHVQMSPVEPFIVYCQMSPVEPLLIMVKCHRLSQVCWCVRVTGWTILWSSTCYKLRHDV